MAEKKKVWCVADSACALGEGILWDPTRGRLYWFDIQRAQMCSCAADGADFFRVDLPRRISAAALAKNGLFAVAADYGFGVYSPQQNRFRRWREIAPGATDMRTNDGRADPHGAFWFGTMENTETAPAGAIYRVSPNEKVRLKIPNITIPNAIAFSPAGDAMYWTDSPEQTIWRCDLSPRGDISNRRVFASLRGKPQVPDGAIVDAMGFLWNAEWDGGRVVRYAPDGGVDRVVNLPVSRPTCPVFGGQELSVIYVSSAREGLTVAELREQPQAGGVFAFNAPPGSAPPVFG